MAVLLLDAWLFRGLFREQAKCSREQREFQEKGMVTVAKIVGRECEDGGEYPDTYYIFYQFRNDFIVKAELKNKHKHYYEMPEGFQVEIEYVSDNPVQSRLKL